MIWLATVSLAAGGLLAQRFKIIVLAPATLLVVLVAVSVGAAQISSFWLSCFNGRHSYRWDPGRLFSWHVAPIWPRVRCRRASRLAAAAAEQGGESTDRAKSIS